MSKPKSMQKWKKSMDHIQNQKSRWRQYSIDKLAILQNIREMSLEKLLEKYPNMPDYFWRDSGKRCWIKFWPLCDTVSRW